MTATLSREDQLQRIADFDHPFRVGEDGTLSDDRGDLAGIYAPDVWHDPRGDIEIHSDQWDALTGYTGQHAYSGAVMHASEYLGGSLAHDILTTPGVYVVVVVNVWPEDAEDEDFDPEVELPEPAGWAVLRMRGA